MELTDFFKMSELSEASYANFQAAKNPDGSFDVGKVQLALKNVDELDQGFSESQAANFVKHWKVVSHQPNTASGFSATVFESLDNPGTCTLAIRGTERDFVFSGANDWLTNVADIGGDGIAIRQALELFNYYQELTAVAGQPVMHYDYVEETVDLFGNVTPAQILSVNTGIATADGELAGSSLSVAGHSLGGHLAMILSRLAPAAIEQVYAFNGPGFDTPIGRKDTALGSDGFFDLLRDASNGPIGTGWEESKIHRISVRGDVVHTIGRTIPGTEQVVFTESANRGAVDAHSIAPMTDALAVYDLFGRLDASVTFAEITSFLGLGSNKPEESLEASVDAIGDLFATGATLAVDNRDALYTRIQAIQQELYIDADAANPILKANYQNLRIVAVADLSRDAGFDTAEGLAYRYALENLNPFAVVGDVDFYAQHNGSGELDAARFSEDYLSDRAAFLTLKNEVFGSDLGTGSVRAYDRVEYLDRASGLLLNTTVIGPDPSRRIVFDADKDEPLTGGVREDHLYGGAGDDILEGKGGDDYLEGGLGNDTYIFSAGDGYDTIFDADGLGSIVLRSAAGDTPLGGNIDSVSGQENLYADSDGNRYAKTGGDLLINLVSGGGMLVKGFADDVLGMRLNPTDVPTAQEAPTGTQFFDLGQPAETAYVVSPTVNGPVEHPVYGPGPWDPYLPEVITAQGAAGPTYNSTGNVITGQVAGGLGDSYIQGDAGFNYLIDDLWYSAGSLTGTPVAWLAGDPVFDPLLQSGVFFSLAGRAGNDVMRGGAGNDWLLSHGGDDWLYGDEGNDFLYDNPGLDFGDNRWLALPGASSDDHLFGGKGNDVLISVQGDDDLDGGADNDVLLSGSGDDILAGGTGNDWLLADAALTRYELVVQPDGSLATLIEAAGDTVDCGNDTLFGDAGDDVLAGGGGDDWLMGGAQNDTLWGDGHSVLDANGAIQITVGDGALAGNDTLFGEQGDDLLLGGGGGDYLDGGDGNDQLEGDHADLDIAGHGNDHLVGGDGDDLLVGNGGDDRLSGDAGDDQLWGDEGDDSLLGGEGLDTLDGGAGNDVISAGGGDDVLTGGDGDDGLFGDGGSDLFDGGDGDDVLYGGDGDDELYGSAGNDLLEGGSGIDSLFGGAGDDDYAINPGSGQDVIVDTQGSNSIAFGAGVTPDSLKLQEVQANDGAYYLDIEYGSSGDRVFIKNGPLGAVSSFSFADGSALSFADLMAQSGLSLSGSGGDGDDIIQGGNAADLMLGGAGNDEIYGGDGADELLGGTGDDLLNGDGGDDALNGGAGNDTLRGGSGRDSYLLHWGMGQDTLVEDGVETSVLQFDAGISLSDLAMTRDGNDLVVQFKGLSDGVRIEDFALSSQLWELRTDDGATTLIDDGLIDSAGAGVVDSAAAAIERYDTRVEAIYYATLAADSCLGQTAYFAKRHPEPRTSVQPPSSAVSRLRALNRLAMRRRLRGCPHLMWPRAYSPPRKPSQALHSMSVSDRHRWTRATLSSVR